MYQAIVFLPLVGAILAGLIALAGARARFPGGSPAVDGHEHRRGAHAHAHAGHDHAAHGAGGHHDAHHPTEPAAAGSRPAELITTTLLFVSMILSWIGFASIGFGQDVHVSLFNWFTAGDLKVDWSLRVDTLTAVMLVVVTSVSAFVHLYSIGYMVEEPAPPSAATRRRSAAHAWARSSSARRWRPRRPS